MVLLAKKYMYKFSLNHQFIAFFLIFITAFIVIYPFATNGFWFDDAAVNSIFWDLQVKNQSLVDFTLNIIGIWAIQNSRLIPLAITQLYSLHYFITDVTAFRIGHLFLLMVNLSVFSWLLRKFGLTWKFIGLWFLVMLAVFQCRDFHDPLAAYGFFLPAQGIFFTLAIIFTLNWFDNPSIKWSTLGSIFAFIALLYYEINLIFYITAFSIILLSKHSYGIKKVALIIISLPLFSYILITIYLRTISPIGYPGVQVGSFGSFIPAYFMQLIASIPGSYYLLRWSHFYPPQSLLNSFLSSPLAWILMISSPLSFFWCLSARSPQLRIENSKKVFLAILVCSLVFITPLFVAISNKYQVELKWGLGYLPVYYSYFGISLLITACIFWITKKNIMSKTIISIIMSVILVISFLSNINVINVMDNRFREPRTTLEHTLQSGLLDRIRDGDYLSIERVPFSFLTPGFIYRYSNKKIIIGSPPDSGAEVDISRAYILDRQKESPRRWLISSQGPLILKFGNGWSGSEGTFRWGISQHAVMYLTNRTDHAVDVKFVFTLNTLKPRNINLIFDDKILNIKPDFLNGVPVNYELDLILKPGSNEFIIQTDIPPQEPGGGDMRKLSFGISNFSLAQ